MWLHRDKPYSYVPWYPSEERLEDSFLSYIHRSSHMTPGGEVPFPSTSWKLETDLPGIHPEDKSDQSVSELVRERLFQDPGVDSSFINVLVINGNVSLTGTVATKKEISIAEQVTRETPHVWSVQNELTVKL